MGYGADYNYPNNLNHSEGDGDQGYALDPGTFSSSDNYNVYPSGEYPSGSYTYRIRSSDRYGNLTKWSDPKSGSIASIDPAPSAGDLQLSSTDNSITATWPAYDGPSYLFMQQRGVDNFLDGSLGLFSVKTAYPELNGAGTMYTSGANGLPSGTTYDFVLWTQAPPDPFPGNGVAATAFTKKSIATTGPAPIAVPAAPDLLSATWDQSGNTESNHHAHLFWHNTPSNEDGFQLQRSTDPTFPTGSKTVTFTNGADKTTYHDLDPDYNHIYYYRVRATNGAKVSGWSPTASLSPGPIIVMFYGADINSQNNYGGNPTMTEILNKIQDRGYQIHSFAGRDILFGMIANPVEDAKNWLISQLDTNGDGKYDPSNGDIARPIEILGYSNGGIEVSFLANDIKTDTHFKSHVVAVAFAIDPVSLYMTGNGRIPNTVFHYYDYYQTNPKGGIGVLFIAPNIEGIAVDSDATFTTEDNIFHDPIFIKMSGQSDAFPKKINHTSIVALVEHVVLETIEQ